MKAIVQQDPDVVAQDATELARFIQQRLPLPCGCDGFRICENCEALCLAAKYSPISEPCGQWNESDDADMEVF